MKFITEDVLRLRYRKESFTEFTLALGTRLTPEAYQFLVDRRITMIDENTCNQKRTAHSNYLFKEQPEAQAVKNCCNSNPLDKGEKHLLAIAEGHLFAAQDRSLVNPLKPELQIEFDDIVAIQQLLKNTLLKGEVLLDSLWTQEVSLKEDFSILDYSFPAREKPFITFINLYLLSLNSFYLALEAKLDKKVQYLLLNSMVKIQQLIMKLRET